SHGSVLEALVPPLLDVLLRDDPSGSGGDRAVEDHEVGPWPLEAEADAPGIGRLDADDTLFEGLGVDSAIAFEGELDVLGRDDLAVVEPDSRSQSKLVDEPVGRHAPRLGQARGHA